MAAATAGHLEAIDALLALGADIDHENKDGQTALMQCAARNLSEQCASLIRQGASINYENRFARTALLAAAGSAFRTLPATSYVTI